MLYLRPTEDKSLLETDVDLCHQSCTHLDHLTVEALQLVNDVTATVGACKTERDSEGQRERERQWEKDRGRDGER